MIVALKDGTIRTYNEKTLVDTTDSNVSINGIIFGIYGREEGSLVINHAGGGMNAKILHRKANFSIA